MTFALRLAAVLAASSPLLAQSFNIDVGDPALGVPSASYGAAAGQPGAWFGCSSTAGPSNPFDVTGAPTSVTLSVTGGLGEGSFPAAFGDEGKLVNDAQLASQRWGGNPPPATSPTAVWTFQGLQNGSDTLYTYAASPWDTADVALVSGAGSLDPDQFVYGFGSGNAEHAAHRFVVTNGTLGVTVSAPWLGPNPTITNYAYVDGFQLVLTSTPSTNFCFGNSTVAPCPCGNTGGGASGCANSLFAQGASLRGSGNASVSSDSFVLLGTQMPNAACLYFQGTAPVNGGFGLAFGDGLRCAGGSIRRLGTKTNSGWGSQYPSAGDAPISAAGLVPAAGGTRTYQAWYRNPSGPCGSGFNLTNGVSVTWIP